VTSDVVGHHGVGSHHRRLWISWVALSADLFSSIDPTATPRRTSGVNQVKRFQPGQSAAFRRGRRTTVGMVAIGLVAACSSSSAAELATQSASDPQQVAQQACQKVTPVAGRPPKIVTTVAPLTSIVSSIVGASGEVVGLVPEGINSHTFEPAPSDAAKLAGADVVFVNGLVLEEPTKDLVKAAAPKSATVCELGTAALPVARYAYDFSFPKDGGEPNPHLWTDPTWAIAYAEQITDVLGNVDPANADSYRANFAEWRTGADALDAAMRAATATMPADNRTLLTYHDAFAYFAKTYGWTVLGAIQPSSFDEPTASEVASLIDQVKSTGVPAIFGSEVFPSPVLEQIGNEADVRYVDTLRDDDLPGEPGDPDNTWFGLMKSNYITMVSALGGDPSALEAVTES
jgi:ABC-type Zn uptake system ZnuABC Zn-binding protein ZnuA